MAAVVSIITYLCVDLVCLDLKDFPVHSGGKQLPAVCIVSFQQDIFT